jgi:hypothetical protein
MAKKLDPRLLDILKQYDERPEEALWDCHGTWVAYHAAIERIAAKADIVFEMPVVIEANSASKVVAIAVKGKMGDNENYREEWSFGEASPGNNKNSYPYAMAEKRAKDRVVLKLVGLHGAIYSEEEADDFKANRAPAVQKPVETKYGEVDPSWRGETRASAASTKKSGDFEVFRAELLECDSIVSLKRLQAEWRAIAKRDGWADSILSMARELIAQQEAAILDSLSTEALADVPLKTALQGSVLLAGE